MDALKAYLDTLRHHPNPNLGPNGSLPALLNGGNPTRGKSLFVLHANHCGVCHVLPTGSDNNVDNMRNFGGIQPIKTPSLSTVYQRSLLDTRKNSTNLSGFGLLHDGSGGKQGLPTVHFYELDGLVGQDFADVAAFVQSFETGTAPSVGFLVGVTSANASDSEILASITALEVAAISKKCDLVVRGRLQNNAVQFLYDPTTFLYKADAQSSSFYREELLSRLGTEELLCWMGTLPGSGDRFSTDRDQDGVMDSEIPPPKISIEASPRGLIASWVATNGGWVMEQADSIQSNWQTAATQPRTEQGITSIELDSPNRPAFFLRLRRTW